MRADKALGELDLSVVTQADKQRIVHVRAGLVALDDIQAELKAAIGYLCEEYTNPNAPDDDCADLVSRLRKLITPIDRRAAKSEVKP